MSCSLCLNKEVQGWVSYVRVTRSSISSLYALLHLVFAIFGVRCCQRGTGCGDSLQIEWVTKTVRKGQLPLKLQLDVPAFFKVIKLNLNVYFVKHYSYEICSMESFLSSSFHSLCCFIFSIHHLCSSVCIFRSLCTCEFYASEWEFCQVQSAVHLKTQWLPLFSQWTMKSSPFISFWVAWGSFESLVLRLIMPSSGFTQTCGVHTYH